MLGASRQIHSCINKTYLSLYTRQPRIEVIFEQSFISKVYIVTHEVADTPFHIQGV